jgi:SAM dependent carboxyl methyltransferase
MVEEMKASLPAMAGGGFYNRHSSLQAAAIEKALPLWRQTVETIHLTGPTIRVVDYGSSQGHNSMAPIGAAIDVLREQKGAVQPIEVIHTDLPGNDFTTLFGAVIGDENSYLTKSRNIFVSAIGRSYFDQLLPAGSVDLGWNSWTLQWMSRNPAEDPDFIYGIISPSAWIRKAVTEQLALDWKAFLRLRSIELKHGGKLFCLFGSRDNADVGWEWLVHMLWTCIIEMRAQGLLSEEDTRKINLPLGPRELTDVRAPFGDDGLYAGLKLAHAEKVESPDPYWSEYQNTKDAGQFGRNWRNFMKAVFAPVIQGAIDPRNDREARTEELLDRFAEKVSSAPRETRHYVVVAVLEKVS